MKGRDHLQHGERALFKHVGEGAQDPGSQVIPAHEEKNVPFPGEDGALHLVKNDGKIRRVELASAADGSGVTTAIPSGWPGSTPANT